MIFSCGNVNSGSKEPGSDSSSGTLNTSFKKQDSTLIDSVALGIRFKAIENYSLSKQKIEQQRLQFFNIYNQLSDSESRIALIDSAGLYYTSAIINDIIPHWYGTVWDFNGYTEIPGKGKIACGYFVSTTLKHAGFRIDRYKMAQQGGYYEARTLQPNSLLKIIQNEYGKSTHEICKELTSILKDGLYFVGLNCHVGYLFVKNRELYFIHSNYIKGYVMIEKAEYSQAFGSSIYIIADITHNPDLILNWIKGKTIPVVTN